MQINSDPANCGSCSNTCAAGQLCVVGSCCDSGLCRDCQSVLVISTSTQGDSALLASLGEAASQAASPVFCAIDYFDANGGATPTPGYLSQYDAVLAYSEVNNPYADPDGLGDSLAEYFDLGGRVVIALFADADDPIGGAFVTEGYLLLAPSNAVKATDSFNALIAAQAPLPPTSILAGVSSISGTGLRADQALQNGGVAVASWASGAPLAVAGTVKDWEGNPRRIVDLNILPTDIATGAWAGDGVRLLQNALLYR